MKTKLEAELKETEKENEELKAKVSKLREESAKLEEEVIVFRATAKQKDILIEELQTVSKRMNE